MHLILHTTYQPTDDQVEAIAQSVATWIIAPHTRVAVKIVIEVDPQDPEFQKENAKRLFWREVITQLAILPQKASDQKKKRIAPL